MNKYQNLLVSINYTNTAINVICKKDTERWAKENNIYFNEGGVEIILIQNNQVIDKFTNHQEKDLVLQDIMILIKAVRNTKETNGNHGRNTGHKV